jgi:hypothetical protein
LSEIISFFSSPPQTTHSYIYHTTQTKIQSILVYLKNIADSYLLIKLFQSLFVFTTPQTFCILAAYHFLSCFSFDGFAGIAGNSASLPGNVFILFNIFRFFLFTDFCSSVLTPYFLDSFFKLV